MQSLPTFPTASLYTGTIPPFPTYNWSWGFNFFGTWEGFSIALPNVLAIPQWIGEVIIYGALWIFGWIAAVYQFAVQYLAVESQNLTTSGISFAFGTYDRILSTVEGITGNTGILSPLLTTLIISGLAIGTLYIAIMAFNGIRSIA